MCGEKEMCMIVRPRDAVVAYYCSQADTFVREKKKGWNYSAFKRSEVLPFATAWMDLEGIVLMK